MGHGVDTNDDKIGQRDRLCEDVSGGHTLESGRLSRWALESSALQGRGRVVGSCNRRW